MNDFLEEAVAMSGVNQIMILLMTLIPIAAGCRAGILYLQMLADPDRSSVCKTKLKNLLFFTIIAECVIGLLGLFEHYFV